MVRIDAFDGNDADRTLRILSSARGRHLHPLEQAFGFQRLSRFGWDNARIAENNRVSPQWVGKMLVLAAANSDVHRLVFAGKASASVAADAVRQHGEDAGAFDRHITFRGPDGGAPYWFEVLTWPGALCIRGDMGTYVFSRLTDMFEFFRTDDRGDPAKLCINKGYWCEKLQAVDCNGWGKGEARRFDASTFELRVKDVFDSHFEECEIAPERKASLWEDVKSEILDYAVDGEAAYAARDARVSFGFLRLVHSEAPHDEQSMP